jgi:MFS family permease
MVTLAEVHARSWQRRWLLVISGGLIMGAALGVRHVQGLFMLPVTLDHGWNRETFGFALALQNLVWGLTQPFTGMIADRFGSLRVLIVSGLVYVLGLGVMSIAGTPGYFTLGCGVLIGMGLSGTAFGAVYGSLSRLFPPKQRSWALGVAGAIGGLGQFSMVPLVQGLLGRMHWSMLLLVLAAIVAAITPLAISLRDHPGIVPANEVQQSMGEAVREALSHRGFWLLNIGFFACGFQLAFIAAHMPSYLIDKGLGAGVAGAALGLIALANIAGTYLCGYFGGLLRRKYLLCCLYLVRSLAMLLFVMVPLTPASVYVFSFVMGLLWLGTVPLTNGLVSQVFGVRYITTLFGFVFFGHQLGGFLGVWLGGIVFDSMHSYQPLWIGSIVLGFIAAALHWPINDGEVKRSSADELLAGGSVA